MSPTEKASLITNILVVALYLLVVAIMWALTERAKRAYFEKALAECQAERTAERKKALNDTYTAAARLTDITNRIRDTDRTS